MQQQKWRYGQSVDGDRRLRNIIEKHRKRSEYDSGNDVGEQWSQTWDWIIGGGLLMGGLFVVHKWNMRALRKSKKADAKWRNIRGRRDKTSDDTIDKVHSTKKEMTEAEYNKLKMRVDVIFKDVNKACDDDVPKEVMDLMTKEDTDKQIREKIVNFFKEET